MRDVTKDENDKADKTQKRLPGWLVVRTQKMTEIEQVDMTEYHPPQMESQEQSREKEQSGQRARNRR